MNKLMFFICGLAFCVTTFAQSAYQPATEAQKKEIVDKIIQASGAMRTMQCDFTQEKELSFMNEKVIIKKRTPLPVCPTTNWN